jgi:tetratricopeptide (TPR) repeat protein
VSDFTTHSPEAYAAYIRGRDALDRFYYEDAHEHLQLAVELDPGFAAAWHQLADLYLRGQYRGAAMRARDRAMALLDKVTWRERLQILALDANLREEHTEATSYLQEIVDRDPQDVDALMALATTQRHDLSDIDLSIPNFERVVALDAGYAAAWNQLAYSYVFGGETDKGLAALDRYLELLPGDANPHDSRGDILAFLGRPEEAQSAYEKALEIRPDFQASTGWKSLIMGVYLGETGLEPRMREYIAATESTEISSAAWFRTHLASLPAYHGRFGEAVDRHEEVLRWMERDDLPDWAPIDTRLYLARLLVHLGRYEEAHARLDEAEPMARETEEFDEWWVGDARVEVLLAEGRGSEARAELARMEQLPPDGDFVYARDWTRARIAEADGDDARALRLYEAASPRDWDYQIAVDLGTRRLRLGAVPRAIEILERAATACTEVRIGCPLSNSRVHYFLGQAYEKAGRPADAAAQYRTLLDLWKNGDPDLPERDDAAARLERLEANL